MVVLPDAWLLVLNVLIGAPLAWLSPAEIAAALGLVEGETTDLLSDLDEAGWLVVWEADAGPLVTLSALAAERLGARLVEVGPREVPRWAREGEPDPPPVRSKHVCRGARAASLEFVADPAVPPDIAAERAEALARTLPEPPPKTSRRGDLPRPTRLVGLSLTPWPGPRRTTEAVCPACGDLVLGPHMYCLYCDRWGLDLLPARSDAVPAVAVAVVPSGRLRPGPDRAAAESLQAERLRARRKSKRRKRHQAGLDAGRRGKPTSTPAPSATPQAPRPTAVVPLHAPPPGKTSSSAER